VVLSSPGQFWPRPATLLVVLLAAAPPASSQTPASREPGGVRGTVTVRLDLPARPVRPDTTNLATRQPRDLPDRSTSVVYLESAPRGAFEPAEQPRARLDQRNEAFHPYVLPIQAGTVVDFPNSDPFFHNVFSLSKTRRFDLGRYPQGRSKSVRFDTPGIVRVFCDIHSHMSAYILVFAHRFFATTDSSGGYRIDGIPPGGYTLAVWTDGKVRETRHVTIAAGEVTEASFEVR
jgi:plastocyanin